MPRYSLMIKTDISQKIISCLFTGDSTAHRISKLYVYKFSSQLIKSEPRATRIRNKDGKKILQFRINYGTFRTLVKDHEGRERKSVIMQFSLQNIILARKSIVLRNIYGKIISHRFSTLQDIRNVHGLRRGEAEMANGLSRYLDRECSEAKAAEKGVRFNPPLYRPRGSSHTSYNSETTINFPMLARRAVWWINIYRTSDILSRLK